jgi:hypothetical protein
VQRAQPDDDVRNAGDRPDPLIPATRRDTQPAIHSCTKALTRQKTPCSDALDWGTGVGVLGDPTWREQAEECVANLLRQIDPAECIVYFEEAGYTSI